MSDYTLQFLLLLILLLLSAFFSLSETAITSISKLKIKNFLETKRKGSKALNELKSDPNKFLGTILVGNNIVNISASAVATYLSIEILKSVGLHEISFAVGIAIGITTFFILVFGEIIPKTVALKNSEILSLFSAPIIKFISIVLFPIIQIFVYISFPFVKLFGGALPDRGAILTLEDVKFVIMAGEKEGVIEEEEKEMISSIFEFRDTIVREIMTPKPDMQCLSSESSVDDAIKKIVESGYSRIPVYEGSLDNIIGVVYAKDLLKTVFVEKKSFNLRDFIRPAIFVPETKKVDDLLHQMQAARTHIAIIVDEYGVTSGLVTLEDLIEEIIGEIYDEFEKKEKPIQKIDKDVYMVDARLSIPDVNNALKINLPKKDYDTLSGFVMDELGKVPSVGDSLKYGNLLLSVERVHKRRITWVRIQVLSKEGVEGEEAVGG